MRRALALVLVVSLSGCSFALVHGPRSQDDPRKRIECTDSYALPVIDGLFTLLAGGSAYYAFKGDTTGRSTAGVVASGVGLVTLASAVYGAVQVSRCKAVQGGLPDPDDIIKMPIHLD